MACELYLKLLKNKSMAGWPAEVAHTCNPALWEAEAGGSQGLEFEAA